MLNPQDFIYKIFLFYIPLLFSLSVHEWAHGWTAKKKGDFTAFHQGRVSLNPIVHIDIIGTLALPLFFIFTGSPLFFGWAKPVPVDEYNLKNPKKDMFWIAFAGPLSNFILAVIGAFLLGFIYLFKLKGMPLKDPLLEVGEVFIYLNILLGIFNLIPLHPLDGSKVLARFLPESWNTFLEEKQMYLSFLLIFVVFSGGFHYLSKPMLFLAHRFIFFAQSFAILASNLLS